MMYLDGRQKPMGAMMETLKQRIITEIFERAMVGVRSAFSEVDEILRQSKEREGLPEDAVVVFTGDHSMILDLIEDRILNAVDESINDMVDDGDLIVNEG